MATWQEFCDSVTKITNKAIAKTSDLADSASMRIKLTQKEATLAELYEQFGKLSYKQIKSGEKNEEKTNELIGKIDTLCAEIASIKADIQAKKDAKDAEKEEAETTNEANAEESDNSKND